jgi:hypothetical protein
VKVLYRSSFERAFKKLAPSAQEQVREAVARFPTVFGKPHAHAGIGIRRVEKFYEFRAGSKLRVPFALEDGDAVLVTVGNHDEVARFIRENA